MVDIGRRRLRNIADVSPEGDIPLLYMPSSVFEGVLSRGSESTNLYGRHNWTQRRHRDVISQQLFPWVQ